MGRSLVRDFITSEFQDSVQGGAADGARREQTANFEFPLYTKDGQRVEVLLNAATRQDTRGKTVGVVGVGQDITELKAGKAELQRVANDLTLLIETANAPIFGIDAGGLVNEWNRKAVEITGFAKEEVMGQSLVAKFITPEFQDSVRGVLTKALGGAETANFEFPLYTKDGQPVDILLNAATRRGPDGAIVGVVGVGQDITELKQEKVEMSRVADDLMRLIDYANAPIFGIDQDGKVNEWNRKAAEITGFSKDEVIGRSLVQHFITPDYQASVKEVLDNALLGKGTDNFEFPLYSRDGKKVEVLLNATTRVDSRGHPHRRHRRRAGHHRAQDGRAGGDAPRDGSPTPNRLGQRAHPRRRQGRTHLRVEQEHEPSLGLHQGRGAWHAPRAECHFIDADNLPAVGEVLERALEGTDSQNFEFALHSKEGKRIELLLNAATRRNATGAIVGVVGVGQDITEKKYMEKAQINAAKIRASNDAKGNFLASMSHEMRTPLNGVLGMLQLAMTYDLPEVVMQNVQNAYMSGEHLLNLVNDVLDVSKIEAGKLELESKPFSVKDVFRTAMDIVRPQALSKGLEIVLQMDSSLPRASRAATSSASGRCCSTCCTTPSSSQ